MIVQSPESTMPEPYKTYVRQRGESIAAVLQTVMGDADVQLCPRAIMSDEQLFPCANGYVYGTVVEDIKDGYKSVLYSREFQTSGLATSVPEQAVAYAEAQFNVGNRVRLKDPRQSDGSGQHTVESSAELITLFREITADHDFGCVLMPHLSAISNRVSIGRINLGGFGEFHYLGREKSIQHAGAEVYGGTSLGLFHSDNAENEARVRQHFDLSEQLVALGQAALDAYERIALLAGRVSIDVMEGITDNGDVMQEVIDVTPRMGGTTPAEVLALREIHEQPEALSFASCELIYNPVSRPTQGELFLDTDDLIIQAQIDEVRQ